MRWVLILFIGNEAPASLCNCLHTAQLITSAKLPISKLHLLWPLPEQFTLLIPPLSPCLLNIR
jgi:hypothetical protein